MTPVRRVPRVMLYTVRLQDCELFWEVVVEAENSPVGQIDMTFKM